MLCLVGFFSGRGERGSTADYFLAGRKLPWYAVGGSYIAANVSTEHFIGLVGASYIMGMPTALGQWQTTMAEVIIVFLFVPFLIRARVVTVPQYLARRFGPGVRLAFALLTIFANITIFMAAVLYAGGLALSGFFGWLSAREHDRLHEERPFCLDRRADGGGQDRRRGAAHRAGAEGDDANGRRD